MTDSRFARTTFGLETCDAGDLVRHRHSRGYMTLVLSSSYVEAGDAGRFHVCEGDVLIHRPFEAHRDLFAKREPKVLNLPLPQAAPDGGQVRIADPDAVALLAEKDLDAAAALLCAIAVPAASYQDWPDLLAAELCEAKPVRIGDWAGRQGLSPATVSRGFRQAYGASPARFRAEARARRAWRAVADEARPLADLALELGFADQAHMTRLLTEITGLSPGNWRRQGQMGSRLA